MHEKTHRNGLNPSGRKAPGHFFPKQRRQRVTDQAIENPTGLLGVHQLHVEVPRLIQRLADGFFGDLVKHHALHGHFGGQQLKQVPANAFPLPVFIRGQEQLIGAF